MSEILKESLETADSGFKKEIGLFGGVSIIGGIHITPGGK